MADRDKYVLEIQTAMQINGRLPYGAEIVNEVLDAIELVEERGVEERKKEIFRRAKKRGEKKNFTHVEIITAGDLPGVMSSDEEVDDEKDH